MIHVCQVVSDTNIGGAGRYLLNYIRYFDRAAFRVTVLIPENSMLKPLLSAFSDIQILEVPFMADKSYDKRCVAYLKTLFSKENIDIIHTHASLSARIAAKQAGIKTVIATRHCIEPKGRFPISILKSILNNRLCDYYIAVSNAVKDNLLSCGIKQHKIRTVYNGVEAVKPLSDEQKTALRQTYGIGGETVFGIFARLEEVKGHRHFIKAAKQFLDSGNTGKFLIVGDGSLEKELKEQAKDVPEIIFTGYVPDTADLLNITDVNVISSVSEAMSLAILESMSLGKPTVATDVGGNGQLIIDGKNGLLVPFADSASMANAFLKLAEDKAFYHQCAKAAKEDYDRAFTAEIMVKNLEQLYKEVAYENK